MNKTTTMEQLMDDEYIELSKRCLANNSVGKVMIKSIPDSEYILQLIDDRGEEVTELDSLSLDDIREFAKDMLNFVEFMEKKIEINEQEI